MSGTVRDISRFNFFQEANEASKKLRKDSKEFINDVYTKSDRNKMSNKERNRVKKFLKDNDYDPKTGTRLILKINQVRMCVLNSQLDCLRIRQIKTN